MSLLTDVESAISEIKVHTPQVVAGLNSLVSIVEVATPIATVINPALGASLLAGLGILKEITSLVNQLTGNNIPLTTLPQPPAVPVVPTTVGTFPT